MKSYDVLREIDKSLDENGILEYNFPYSEKQIKDLEEVIDEKFNDFFNAVVSDLKKIGLTDVHTYCIEDKFISVNDRDSQGAAIISFYLKPVDAVKCLFVKGLIFQHRVLVRKLSGCIFNGSLSIPVEPTDLNRIQG